jgi:hypothetical protein
MKRIMVRIGHPFVDIGWKMINPEQSQPNNAATQTKIHRTLLYCSHCTVIFQLPAQVLIYSLDGGHEVTRGNPAEEPKVHRRPASRCAHGLAAAARDGRGE